MSQNLVKVERELKSLSLAESAEIDRQRGLDKIAVSKAYPDAQSIMFNGTSTFTSSKVNTKNFTSIEFIHKSNPMLSQSAVSARLWHTVKRPGRPRIKVYSETLYAFTVEHLIKLANGMNPKVVMDKIGHVLKSQERDSRPNPTHS